MNITEYQPPELLIWPSADTVTGFFVWNGWVGGAKHSGPVFVQVEHKHEVTLISGAEAPDVFNKIIRGNMKNLEEYITAAEFDVPFKVQGYVHNGYNLTIEITASDPKELIDRYVGGTTEGRTQLLKNIESEGQCDFGYVAVLRGN